jgi:tetratricopeptide (TPR) repeat protein
MLLLAVGCSRDPEVLKREYLASGDSYVQQGKLNEAVIEYRNAIQQDARFGDARYKLADVYTRLNDLPNAMREYIRAADLLPDRADVQLKAGTMLLLAGRYDDAKARAQQALKVEPRNLDAHILLGNATAGLKDLDQAVAEIEKGIAENPDEGRGYGTLGALELARGNREEAEKALLEAVRLAPDSIPAHLALANLYWSTNRPAETEQSGPGSRSQKSAGEPGDGYFLHDLEASRGSRAIFPGGCQSLGQSHSRSRAGRVLPANGTSGRRDENPEGGRCYT